jgi:hypothetical protein
VLKEIGAEVAFFLCYLNLFCVDVTVLDVGNRPLPWRFSGKVKVKFTIEQATKAQGGE